MLLSWKKLWDELRLNRKVTSMTDWMMLLIQDLSSDAVNTGLLVEKLEMNPDYQLISYEMPDKPSERLSSTLGELFAGLDLRFT